MNVGLGLINSDQQASSPDKVVQPARGIVPSRKLITVCDDQQLHTWHARRGHNRSPGKMQTVLVSEIGSVTTEA